MIGGGSSINAQLYTRGNARRLRCLGAARTAARAGAIAEVLPYFKRAEDNQRFADDYHGYGGPLGVSDADQPAADLRGLSSAPAQELGIPYNPDFNGAQQAGVGYYQLTQRNAPPLLRRDRLSQPDPRPHEPDGADRRAR